MLFLTRPSAPEMLFTNAILQYKKPGVLGEMADSLTKEQDVQRNPENLVLPEKKKNVYTHILMGIFKGYRNQAK